MELLGVIGCPEMGWEDIVISLLPAAAVVLVALVGGGLMIWHYCGRRDQEK
jgi:hypothetical protein